MSEPWEQRAPRFDAEINSLAELLAHLAPLVERYSLYEVLQGLLRHLAGSVGFLEREAQRATDDVAEGACKRGTRAGEFLVDAISLVSDIQFKWPEVRPPQNQPVREQVVEHVGALIERYSIPFVLRGLHEFVEVDVDLYRAKSRRQHDERVMSLWAAIERLAGLLSRSALLANGL